MKRFPMGIYWLLLGLIVLLGFLPLLTTIVAAAITDNAGCTISHAMRSPCMIGGTDWSEWLQFGGISFVYFFITGPLAFVLFLVWLIVLVLHRTRFGRKVAA